MLDYFGQSPIIVRSSSLLEDAFGNAFAGKYESVFCVNQGSRDKRLEDFMSAVRTIYASTMSEKALQLPGAARAARPGRADGPAGPAGVGLAVRQPVLPAGRRRGVLVQPVRLERGHRPEGGHAAAGVRPGHAGGRPLRRRLHARGRAQRPGAAPGGQLRPGPPLRPAQGRRPRPGGQPARLQRLRRRDPPERRDLPLAGVRLARSANWTAWPPRPAARTSSRGC